MVQLYLIFLLGCIAWAVVFWTCHWIGGKAKRLIGR